MNREYAVVNLDGRAQVLREIYHPGEDIKLQFHSFEDFARLHDRHKITVWRAGSPARERVGLGTAWLDWPERAQYDGIVFDPTPDGRLTPPNYFNLWRGFGVEPRPGDWSLLQEHTFDNLCNGDPALYDYLLDLMAQAVQEPHKPPGVALVLISPEKGTGKSTFAKYFAKLFGPHGRTVSNPNARYGAVQ